MTWIHELVEKERGSAGSICETGKTELQGIAHRMRKRLNMDNDLSGDIIIENTIKERTQQSRDVFLCMFFVLFSYSNFLAAIVSTIQTPLQVYLQV